MRAGQTMRCGMCLLSPRRQRLLLKVPNLCVGKPRHTFDDLLSARLVHLLLSRVGLQHTVKHVRFALETKTIRSEIIKKRQ